MMDKIGVRGKKGGARARDLGNSAGASMYLRARAPLWRPDRAKIELIASKKMVMPSERAREHGEGRQGRSGPNRLCGMSGVLSEMGVGRGCR